MQKKLLSLVLMLIAAINIFAYDFESNGIYYNILSKENRTCTVTSQPNTTEKKYTGTIVIPSTVQDNNGEDYTVTEIGNYAFMDCVKLQNIVLPNTIQEIGYSAFPNSIKRNYGEEIPELSCTYIGFKNKETSEVLTKKPNVYTIATSTSDAGSYPIYCSDAEAKNYTLDYKQGILTISKAKQEITWEQEFENTKIGDAIELTATSSSGLPVKYRSTDLSTVMISSKKGKQYAYVLKTGTAVLTAYQNGDINHEEADEVNKIINIQNTGIDDVNNGEEKIAVENGSITISQIKDNKKVSVTNMSGKTMLVIHAKTGQTLKTPTLPKGIYILSVGSQNYKLAIP